MKRIVVVVPTYNERENIAPLLDSLLRQARNLTDCLFFILVVDDSSPDGTFEVVNRYSKIYYNVHLLKGKKEGLGVAYIRGFNYALNKLKADIVFEMDADFSHNPADIPRFIKELEKGADFVIGSRYVEGGSVPNDWPFLRKINSRWGNIFARYVAGIVGIKDCTSGFRAIRASVLREINLSSLGAKGYSFQMNLLYRAFVKKSFNIVEIPINFVDRKRGESKIRIKDIQEFISNAFVLRFPVLKPLSYMVLIFIFFLAVGSVMISIFSFFILSSFYTLVSVFVAIFSAIVSLQAAMNIFWMLYAWDDPKRVERNRAPKKFKKAKLSFTALVPARNEEGVIGDTLKAIANINYPEHLKEVVIICRFDDVDTILAVKKAINNIGKPNIRLEIFNDFPINKPHGLNVGLRKATKDVVVVFDAEDEPHPDIYNIVNSVMIEKNFDIVQSGVQLMNFNSRWFSSFNVLEYFFWFKSTLHFFANFGVIPLGGNTVFFKRKLLLSIGGWDENCLTEDADIGIRLSVRGAKIGVVYDERYVTKEETPPDVISFIKQRTRWNQGFIQVLFKGDWASLPRNIQKFLAFYIFISPEIQALNFIYLPFSLYMIFWLKLPIYVALISFLPFYLLIFQLILYNVGLFEFTRSYGFRYSVFASFRLLVLFYPYQILLGLSSFRAMVREFLKRSDWEKTEHLNIHRTRNSYAIEKIVSQ